MKAASSVARVERLVGLEERLAVEWKAAETMAGMCSRRSRHRLLLRRQEHRHQENRPQSVPTRP